MLFDSWLDLKDDQGSTLYISKLEYKTKHGKRPTPSQSMFTQGIWSLLSVWWLAFFGSTKDFWWSEQYSSLSLMKLIKTSAINERLHAYSFGKVNELVYYMKSFIIWIHLLQAITDRISLGGGIVGDYGQQSWETIPSPSAAGDYCKRPAGDQTSQSFLFQKLTCYHLLQYRGDVASTSWPVDRPS